MPFFLPRSKAYISDPALALDGGASSTMVENGVVKNVPSDGSERWRLFLPLQSLLYLATENGLARHLP